MRTKEQIRQLVNDALKAKNLDCEVDLTMATLIDRAGLWQMYVLCNDQDGFIIVVEERGSDDDIKAAVTSQLP